MAGTVNPTARGLSGGNIHPNMSPMPTGMGLSSLEDIITMLRIRKNSIPWSISPLLVNIIENAISDAGIDTGTGVIVTFRDPDYCPDSGGYHPVEISIDPDGGIQYVTDFAYYGRPPDCELSAELDFSFETRIFHHFGTSYPLREGLELFKLWQSNFLAYHDMDVFTVTVRPLA